MTLDLSSTLKFNTYFFEILEGLRAPFQKKWNDTVTPSYIVFLSELGRVKFTLLITPYHTLLTLARTF